MVGGVQGTDRGAVQVAVPLQPAQAAPADLGLHGQEVGGVEIEGGVKDGLAILVKRHPVLRIKATSTFTHLSSG